MTRSTFKSALTASIAIAAIGVFGAPAQAANTIPLSGTAGAVCSLSTNTDPAATSLPITTPGLQTIAVGTVLQSCNIAAGYTLSVTSANCAATPNGAKLVQGANQLPFSVNAANPTTGGSAGAVSGLLANACTNQIARDVTSASVTNEMSSIGVVFTGSAALLPGTYQDTLTFTMTTK